MNVVNAAFVCGSSQDLLKWVVLLFCVPTFEAVESGLGSVALVGRGSPDHTWAVQLWFRDSSRKWGIFQFFYLRFTKLKLVLRLYLVDSNEILGKTRRLSRNLRKTRADFKQFPGMTCDFSKIPWNCWGKKRCWWNFRNTFPKFRNFHRSCAK